MTTGSEVLLAIDAGVAHVTLNRPPHNAMNPALLRGLADAADEVAAHDDVFLTVIRGQGDFAFCAGGDISWMADQTPLSWNEIAHDLIGRAINKVATLPMPTVAAVDGYALGGGFELALACDMIVAARHSRFALSEVQLGVFPGGGGTVRLARNCGANLARELIYTGRRLPAEEGHRIGVVNRVAADGALDAAVEQLTEELRATAPRAVRLAKRSTDRALDLPQRDALAYEADLVSLLFGGDEQREGFNAFVEGRPPIYDRRAEPSARRGTSR